MDFQELISRLPFRKGAVLTLEDGKPVRHSYHQIHQDIVAARANLLLREPMYPEYIQGAAKPEVLARELDDCLKNPARIARTQQQAARLRALLSQPAAGSAVEWMLRHLA